MLRIDIITIFPDMFKGVVQESILKRAQDKKKAVIKVYDLRRYTDDKKHHKVDDRPFGGGPGMVLSAQPIFDAVRKIKGRRSAKVIYMSPAGKVFNQVHAKRLAKSKNLIILCGRYEGIDERVRLKLIDEEISIGDYVLTGGEIPAMAILDAVVRLVPGVVGKKASLAAESFEGDMLDFPQYTRPANFRGIKTPLVLLSGNHKAIHAWRQAQALAATKKNRPDLLDKKKRSLADARD